MIVATTVCASGLESPARDAMIASPSPLLRRASISPVRGFRKALPWTEPPSITVTLPDRTRLPAEPNGAHIVLWRRLSRIGCITNPVAFLLPSHSDLPGLSPRRHVGIFLPQDGLTSDIGIGRYLIECHADVLRNASIRSEVKGELRPDTSVLWESTEGRKQAVVVPVPVAEQ